MNKENNAKSGFVAVLGRPNVGKSTLINAILDQKIAAVSPRPQTTRKRQMGILTLRKDEMLFQVVFIDTPGIHNPRHKLGERMNQEALQTLEECDIVLIIVDASTTPQTEDLLLFNSIRQLGTKKPIVLALNKIDLVDSSVLQNNQQVFHKEIPTAEVVAISALNKSNLGSLVSTILEALPAGEPYFPEDQTTDLFERDLTADLIRETALNLLRDEIPHGIAIRIDQFLEREDHGAYIEATVFLERESHKPIVIGKGGQMLKRIGSAARKEIEAMSGRSIYLQLNVKVRKNWRDDDKVLRQFGY